MRIRTQWRHGFNGLTGLDYAAIYPLLDRLGLDPAAWDALLADVQVMEFEVLEMMAERSAAQ